MIEPPTPPDPISLRARRAWGAAYALLAVTAVWVLLEWAGILVVVGSIVVPVWAAVPVLLAAWVVVRVGLRVRGVPRPAPSARGRWLRPAVTRFAWVLGPVTAAASVLGGPVHTVVEPATPDGCRAVVAERGWLFRGWGTVHVLGGWGPLAPRVGGYDTDDAASPVADGEYQLSWDAASGGSLSVSGALPGGRDSASPAGLFDIDC